jgi:hypothetical protein
MFSVGSCQLQAVINVQPLSLSPKSTLKWAGFSDEGTLFALDSAGMLRMFSRKGYWLPVCDTQANVCIFFFMLLHIYNLRAKKVQSMCFSSSIMP